jgi:hypothetical protein
MGHWHGSMEVLILLNLKTCPLPRTSGGGKWGVEGGSGGDAVGKVAGRSDR